MGSASATQLGWWSWRSVRCGIRAARCSMKCCGGAYESWREPTCATDIGG